MFFRRSNHPKEIELSAYVDGELDAARTQRVSGHLESCAECRAALEGLRETKALMAALPRYEAPRPFVLSASQAGVQSARPVAARPNALRFAPALSLAVLAILVVVDIATPATRTTVTTSHGNLVSKSQAETADSAAGNVLQAPNASAAQSSRATNSDAGVPGSTAPSAGAAVVPPSAAAPSIGSLPAPPVPSTGGQASSSASPPQIQSFSAPVAPGATPVPGAPVPAPAIPPTVGSPQAIQPFSPQAPSVPGPTTPVPQAAGGAGSAGASPVLPIAPQPGVLVPVPLVPSPAPDASLTVVTTTHSDITLLRVLEILAAAAFMASLLVVFWPRLTRKER